jgi:hypothetical protein
MFSPHNIKSAKPPMNEAILKIPKNVRINSPLTCPDGKVVVVVVVDVVVVGVVVVVVVVVGQS